MTDRVVDLDARRKASLGDLAEATPAGRDRYVDFLRAFSILVVVLGHWLIATIFLRDGEASGVNALEVVPGLWIATWLLQVMPVFFLVGGFSNLVSYESVLRRGGGYARFIHDRLRRLMRPTAVFLIVWLGLTALAEYAVRVDREVLGEATRLLGRPLWFIGIYLIVIALAPPMVRLHHRFGAAVPVAMVAGAAAVDVADIGLGIPFVGYLNFGLVWLLVHQLGFFYADGRLTRMPRAATALAAVGGLAALTALTTLGPYSPSMVGLVGERSNTNPPTVCIIALTVWQVGLILLLRPSISRWLQRRRVWAAVIGLNLVIMTVFLWHQTAMLAGAGVLLPLGFPQPEAGSALWWALRPVWILVLSLALVLLVIVFGRFERPPAGKGAPDPAEPGRGKPLPPQPLGTSRVAAVFPAAAGLGAAFVVLGVLGFAVGGFDGLLGDRVSTLIVLDLSPLQNVFHLMVGGVLANGAVRGRAALAGALAAAGAALLVIGLLGLYTAGRPAVDILALNPAGNLLHLGAAAGLLGLWASARRSP
ncbi:MAG: acyltransferase family protein [Actinomycetota bacterium]